ncbi:hypothetical protein M1466_00315 [Candidatus Dependentiae bacterium]|nr:hypothetical protein [Candidatus Dependentiae bacterium]
MLVLLFITCIPWYAAAMDIAAGPVNDPHDYHHQTLSITPPTDTSHFPANPSLGHCPPYKATNDNNTLAERRHFLVNSIDTTFASPHNPDDPFYIDLQEDYRSQQEELQKRSNKLARLEANNKELAECIAADRNRLTLVKLSRPQAASTLTAVIQQEQARINQETELAKQIRHNERSFNQNTITIAEKKESIETETKRLWDCWLKLEHHDSSLSQEECKQRQVSESRQRIHQVRYETIYNPDSPFWQYLERLINNKRERIYIIVPGSNAINAFYPVFLDEVLQLLNLLMVQIFNGNYTKDEIEEVCYKLYDENLLLLLESFLPELSPYSIILGTNPALIIASARLQLKRNETEALTVEEQHKVELLCRMFTNYANATINHMEIAARTNNPTIDYGCIDCL